MSIQAKIYLGLSFIAIIICATQHGSPQKTYNFWATLAASVPGWALLYYGGFFGVVK